MGGYSFPEVLFAVVVLGIGFIMIAAIFPVAIQQSKSTADETTGAALARGSASTLTRIASDYWTKSVGNGLVTPAPLMPATGIRMLFTGMAQQSWTSEVRPIDTLEGWNAIKGSLIFAQDPRYAFVPLYRRDGDPNFNPLNNPPSPTAAGTAQIFVIALLQRGLVAPRQNPEFGDSDINRAVAAPTAGTQHILNTNNLCPHQVTVTRLTDGGTTNPDILMVNGTILAPSTGAQVDQENRPDAINEGAFIVMRFPHPTTRRYYFYRIGTRRTDLDSGNDQAWELQPGSDMLDNTENITATTHAWVVGCERTSQNPEFQGPAQDVACYTTIIPIYP